MYVRLSALKDKLKNQNKDHYKKVVASYPPYLFTIINHIMKDLVGIAFAVEPY